MDVLVISSRIPYPLHKGDKLRLYYQIADLAKVVNVHLICLTDSKFDEDQLKKHLPNGIKLYLFKLSLWSRIINSLLGLLKGMPLQVAYFYNIRINESIQILIQKINPGHLFCHLIRASEYVKHLPIPKTLDYMDCFYLNSLKRSESSKSIIRKFLWKFESSRTKPYEKKIASFFDHKLIISSNDYKAIEVPETRILPNGISDAFFSSVHENRDIDLLFIGNLSYYSNIEAIEYLLETIWPAVYHANHSLKLCIAGAEPNPQIEQKILSKSEILYLKNVEKISELYKRAKIFIAPITKGTGQQNKILEALAGGCSVICSREVKSAFEQEFPSIKSCTNASTYISTIHQLLSNYDSTISDRQESQTILKKHYNWTIINQKLISLIKQT